MTLRTIISAERREDRTIINLACGHARSIGGHVWNSGKTVPQPGILIITGATYNCQDGKCYEGTYHQ